MQRIFVTMATVFCVALLTVVAGCNTMQGIGKDIEAGGKAIEKAAGK